MYSRPAQFIAAVLLFAALDAIWLGWLAGWWYELHIGYSNTSGDCDDDTVVWVRWGALAVSYALMALTVMYLALPFATLNYGGYFGRVDSTHTAVQRAHYCRRRERQEKANFWAGAEVGLLVYGIYNFTNLSFLEEWDIPVAIVDTLWGALAFGIVTTVTAIVGSAFDCLGTCEHKVVREEINVVETEIEEDQFQPDDDEVTIEEHLVEEVPEIIAPVAATSFVTEPGVGPFVQQQQPALLGPAAYPAATATTFGNPNTVIPESQYINALNQNIDNAANETGVVNAAALQQQQQQPLPVYSGNGADIVNGLPVNQQQGTYATQPAAYSPIQQQPLVTNALVGAQPIEAFAQQPASFANESAGFLNNNNGQTLLGAAEQQLTSGFEGSAAGAPVLTSRFVGGNNRRHQPSSYGSYGTRDPRRVSAYAPRSATPRRPSHNGSDGRRRVVRTIRRVPVTNKRAPANNSRGRGRGYGYTPGQGAVMRRVVTHKAHP